MKKWTIILIWISWLTSCGNMEDLELKGIENVKINKIGFRGSTISLDIRYHNPNSKSGILKTAEGDAWMDETYLGHFMVDSAVSIPAKSDFLVPVQLSVDMKKILQNSITALFKEEVELKISGHARAGKPGLFRNYTLSYSGKQNLGELLK